MSLNIIKFFYQRDWQNSHNYSSIVAKQCNLKKFLILNFFKAKKRPDILIITSSFYLYHERIFNKFEKILKIVFFSIFVEINKLSWSFTRMKSKGKT